MKKLFVVCAVICILLSSCGSRDERAVTKAFRKYGSENFASAFSIRKIISVEVIDTLSVQEHIKLAREYSDIMESSLEKNLRFMGNMVEDPRYAAIADNQDIPELTRRDLMDALDDCIEFQHKYGLEYINTRCALRLFSAGLETVINEYRIRARVNENGVGEVREYFAIVKNGNLYDIKIQDHPLTNEEMPEPMGEINELVAYGVELLALEEECFGRLRMCKDICDQALK